MLLRAAVGLANLLFEPPSVRPLSPDSAVELKPDDSIPEVKLPVSPATPISIDRSSSINPYAAPTTYGNSAKSKADAPKLAIPTPSLGKSLVIVILQSLICTSFAVMLGIFVPSSIAAVIVAIAIGFAAAIAIYGTMLPTTLGKAVAIYLFLLLLIVVSFFAVGLGIFIIGSILTSRF